MILEEGGRELEKIDVMRYTTGDEAPIINRVKTVDGERNFIQNLKQVADHQAYKGRLHFRWKPEEGIYGLGQAEEGIYNYRGHDQYLYQHNMRIPMPVLLSDQGYGMLFNCGSLMTFHDGPDDSYLFFDTISQMDYYFIAKQTPDGIIGTIRSLTGRAGHAAEMGVRLYPVQGAVLYGKGAGRRGEKIPGARGAAGLRGAGLEHLGSG